MDPVYLTEEYVADDGTTPFGQWLLSLQDKRAQAKIRARLTRTSFGNFGDWKPIANATGLREMREHYGPGYRIYYSVVGIRIVLLLAGSTKKDQKKAIANAKSHLVDYLARIEPNEKD